LLLGSAGILAAATIVQSCCEIGAASDAESLASADLTSCSGNHAKGQMSVVLSSRAARWDNDLLKNTWNGAMKTFINPKVLSLKSVESVDGDTDTVRFLQLDGKFGNGLGVGARVLGKLFKEGERGSGLLGSGTLTNIQEALEVRSPDPAVSRKFNPRSPLNALEEFMELGHPDGDVSQFATSTFEPSEQWAPAQTRYTDAISALRATITASNKIVRIAVLDTGIDVDHPDLKDVIDRNLAYNALTGKVGASEVDDKQGHGTHVAGIIAGQGKGKSLGMAANVRGVVGEFPNNIRIVPIKVLGDDGTGSTAAMNRGIRWATKNNIDVISMSLGSGSNYDCLKDQGLKDPVIQEAIDKGIIVIAAAGNESCPLGGECKKENPSFVNYTVLPCAADNVLCVGSNDFNEAPSGFSNHASTPTETVGFRVAPDIVAPGTKILSTYPRSGKFLEYGGVAILDGTSMATPYVSGIAALMKLAETDKYPVNQATFKTYLQEAAYKSSTYEQKFKVGRVDLKAMVDNRQNRINGNATRVSGTEKKVSFDY
jgi:subtilisin family serine protease